MRCSSGHDSEPGAHFCSECGEHLESELEPPAPVAALKSEPLPPPVGATRNEEPQQLDAEDKSGKKKLLLIGAVVVAAIGLVALLVAVAGDSDELTPIAQEACDELDGAIVLQVGGIVSSAISDAEDANYTGPELGDEMREICPWTMRQVEMIGEEREARVDEREARDALPSQMDLDLERCGRDEVTGKVTNNSDERVDIFIEVTFFDFDRVQIGDSTASVSGLRPGGTATWDAYVPVDKAVAGDRQGGGYNRCTPRISNVFVDD